MTELPFVVRPVACLHDNYAYLVSVEGSDEAFVVDPSESEPIEAALAAAGRTLTAIVLTHHHPDHVAGAPALAARRPGLPVYGFSGDTSRIDGLTHGLHDGDVFSLLGLSLHVLHVPGHTLGAVAYLVSLPDHSPAALFTGDTLFIAGCGRMFEGTKELMRRSLVEVLGSLPETTQVFCGHEYTEANLRFAAAVEPHNRSITAAIEKAAERRAKGIPTVPSTLAEQRMINPFLRDDVAAVRAFVGLSETATPADVFGALRSAKDSFRG
jgi:hydroxyacylglutathione hydrolase